jgi:hypothetical protein
VRKFRARSGAILPPVALAGVKEGTATPVGMGETSRRAEANHRSSRGLGSAAMTAEAEPQLRELGAALRNPRLKGFIISIGGHSDAAFNRNPSERRAETIRWYLVDNFAVTRCWRRVPLGISFGPPNKVSSFAAGPLCESGLSFPKPLLTLMR